MGVDSLIIFMWVGRFGVGWDLCVQICWCSDSLLSLSYCSVCLPAHWLFGITGGGFSCLQQVHEMISNLRSRDLGEGL